VRVMTCTHTPRRNGLPSKAGDFDLVRTLRRPLRTSWLMVGIRVVRSENWRKEENATKPKKVGKNFLAKSTDWSEPRAEILRLTSAVAFVNVRESRRRLSE